MSKRTTFTTISPLPVNITRQVVIDFLHDHEQMIDLNPLVKERHPIKPPPHASPDELHCIWYSLTDKISYLPGGLADGDVTYSSAFHDLPDGLQTHCYAPAGLNIRSKWTLNGSLPGEPVEPVELGIGAPLSGLYIREDVDMRCNVIMASFVKKTLKKSHAALVDRLKVKAQEATATQFKSLPDARPSSTTTSVYSNNSRPWTPSSSGLATGFSSSDLASIPPALHPGRTPAKAGPQPYQPPPNAPPAAFSSPQPQYMEGSHPGPVSNFYDQGYPPPYQQPSHPQSHPQMHTEHGHYPAQPTTKYPPPPHADVPADASTSNLHPDPLRLLRKDSVGSVYPDENDSTAWQSLKPGPSVKYREGHRDYPQMNPYSAGAGEKAQHWVTTAPAPAPMPATLNGPFIAELE